METCKLCKQAVGTLDVVTLTEKGATGINNASKERKSQLSVIKGQVVHVHCRKEYTKRQNINNAVAEFPIYVPSTPKLRSDQTFSFRNNCLICGKPAELCSDKRKRPLTEVWAVRTHDFQKTIEQACNQRKDQWAEEVWGRIAFVNDLHAFDAIYHQQCSVNFRTGKDKPVYRDTISSKKVKGRPVNEIQNDAFIKVVKYFEENDDEQISVNDLVEKMKEYLDDDHEAYGFTHMKSRLEKHFGKNILITEIAGKANIVTFTVTAAEILHQFRESMRNDTMSPQTIIKTAAKLLKSDI